MAWTPQAQLTRSATRASANSTENTAASLASLPCAMSKLFERTVSSPHDHLVAGATGLEPAASCVTGRRSNQLNYAPHTTSSNSFRFPLVPSCSIWPCRDRVAGRCNLLEINGTDSPFLVL